MNGIVFVESDFECYFGIVFLSVYLMILVFKKKKFIILVIGKSRSIELLIEKD